MKLSTADISVGQQIRGIYNWCQKELQTFGDTADTRSIVRSLTSSQATNSRRLLLGVPDGRTGLIWFRKNTKTGGLGTAYIHANQDLDAKAEALGFFVER